MAESTQKVCNRCKKLKTVDNYIGKNDNIFKQCLRCRELDNASKIKTKCIHNRRKSQCKDCGGSSICEHNRIKNTCKDCGGSSICEHNRRKSQCKDCGGSYICEHNRIKNHCKICGGSSICEHNRIKNTCKDCGDEIQITIKSMINHSKQADKKTNRFEGDKFIDYEFVKELIENSKDKCYYCKCDLQYIHYQANLATIERLDNSLGHIKGNCVVACRTCNFSKVGDKK